MKRFNRVNQSFCICVALIGFAAYAQNIRTNYRIQKSSELIVDDSDGESLTEEKTRLLAQKRKGLIEDIKRFLREARSEKQKLELSLRLGSLYLEDYRALTAASIGAGGASGAGGADEAGQKAATLTSRASLDKALSIYKALLSKYPDHPKSDEMLYSLALASVDKGKMDSAMHYFQKLSLMKSRYAGDAFIQLGDYYFDLNNFSKALDYFDKIIQTKNKRLLPYAVYKKAWCLYNNSQFLPAINHFKWVARIDNKESTIRVRQEAIRDIALPFVESRNIDEAIAFYANQDVSPKRQGLEVMAGLLLEQGAYTESIRIYSHLLEMDPNWKTNPSYEIGIVEALRSSNKTADSVDRLFSRFPLYSQGSTWYDINSNDPRNIAEFKMRFEETARKYALSFHAEGQKTKNTTLYDAAKSLYSKYLEYFPNTAHAPKIRFYMAEILFRQNDLSQAASEYYLIYEDKSAGPLRIDAIRYSLAALDHLVNNVRKDQGLAQISSKTKKTLKVGDGKILPFSETEARFLKVGNEYIHNFGDQKDIPDVLYAQSYLRYSHRAFADAHQGFWNLIQRFPKHETAQGAAYLVLDILNQQGDYKGLITVCKQLLQNRDLSRPIFKADVASVLRQTELKRISQMEIAGEFKRAAEEYIEYTKAYGSQDDSLFEKALFNAGINFSKANLVLSGLEAHEHFLRRFPRSELREKALLGVAMGYESVALLDKSALYYEQFVREFPEHPQAQSAWRLAALYYWGSAHHRQAESLLVEFRKRYPDNKTVVMDLLDIFESQGLTTKQTQFYLNERAKKNISAAEYLSLSFKIADIQLSRGKLNKTLHGEISRAAKLYRKDLLKSPSGVDSLARLAFWETSTADSQFHGLHLDLRNLSGRLKQKLVLLKSVDTQYTEIVRLGSRDWGLGSLYRSAYAYHQMALEVSQAPVPPELSREELDIYRAELNRELISPFKEKALLLSKTCLEKSQEFNLLSVWVTRCYDLASELDPQNYVAGRSYYLPPLTVAVAPQAESRIPIGEFKVFNYPFYSSALFLVPVVERTISRLPELEMASQVGGLGPRLIDYRSLADDRKNILTKLAGELKPGDGEMASFAFLNIFRCLNPQKATPHILKSIQSDPQNAALHNLLALSYLDQGNLTAAKVTWLSLMSRTDTGVHGSPAQSLNNLGVVAWMENKPAIAEEYWNEAIGHSNSKEASLNLGAVALKFRNGFEAKKHFERAGDSVTDATRAVGHGVALLQNREFEAAREMLLSAAKRFKSDPYARLSIGYFLIDIEQKPGAAASILSEFAETHDDREIAAALSETKRSLAATTSAVGLPMIEQ